MSQASSRTALQLAISAGWLALIFLLPVVQHKIPVNAGLSRQLRLAISAMRSSEGEFNDDVANYYNALIDSESASLPRVLMAHGWTVFRINWPMHETLLTFPVKGFELFRMKANAAFPSPAGWVRTNSFGMVDQEYEVKPAPNVRRIAFLGDSLVRGLGTALGDSLEAQLEDRLNQHSAGGQIQRFEILNFGFSGYQLTQLLAVAEDRAAPFSPGVYLVGLTRQHASPTEWGDHLYRLIHSGRELRYPFLRRIADAAGLTAKDTLPIARQKLAPYFDQGFRGSVLELKRLARENRATLVFVLLPTLEGRAHTSALFVRAKQILAEESLTVIDVLGAFEKVDDTHPLRVQFYDPHPNRRGHSILCEALLQQLLKDPELFEKIIGRPPDSRDESLLSGSSMP